MGSERSLEEVEASLEKRVAFHREKEAFHSQQEAHHREQRELHAAELEKVQQSLEGFRAASARAVELARPVEAEPVKPPTPAVPEIELPPPNRLMASRLVSKLAGNPDLPEPFSPSTVAQEVNRRFGAQLPKPLTARAASDILRRLAENGEIHLVREGRPFLRLPRRPPLAGSKVPSNPGPARRSRVRWAEVRELTMKLSRRRMQKCIKERDIEP
ncbi:MAG: hypothetical protein ACLGI9_26200 [Thermoanaerobaculia bacterium]